MTIRELLNMGTIMLKSEKIESPKLKARIILQHTLKKTREYLIVYDLEQTSNKEKEEYVKNIKKVIEGMPLQYLTGKQEFMKMDFKVNKDVLIPRQDTEILVEEVINLAKDIKNPVILDLCTGSGAIAVSIAKYVKNVKVYAIDISKNAIEIAKENAVQNGVINNVKFIESDLFEKLQDEKFDIIVSNPPYIATKEIKKLSKEVQNEPRLALDGGTDGLKFYRKILQNAYKFLKVPGYLCLEIGYDQKNAVKEIIEKEGRYIENYCIKDLCQNDRVIVAKR